MRPRLFLLLLAVAFGLAGCFSGKGDLIGDKRSVAPFAKITYAEKGSAEKMVLVRQGKHYRVENGKKNTGTVRFMDTGGGTYVVEASAAEHGKRQYLYAFLTTDPAAKTAAGYKALAGDADAVLPKGLSHCNAKEPREVCIDNLDVYVAYGRAAVAAGAKPDSVWEFTTE